MRLPLYRWVGLKNYLQVFSDPHWDSLWRTLYFVGPS
jgi:ABC-type sugar transport system permease subunit